MQSIDKHSVIPLYHQLVELLREQIRAGDLSSGDQVPSERDLMQAYRLSRNTVRQAMGILENEGLIIRDHGHGTYVSNLSNTFHYMLDTFLENYDLLRRAGYTPSMQQVSTQKVFPPDIVSRALRLQEGEEAVCHTMIFYADDRPAMYTQDYLPDKMVGENNPPAGGERFWEYLERSSSNHIEYVLIDISPVEAVGEIAEAFKVPPGSPILLFKETFLDETQTVPIAFSLNYFNREVLSFNLLTRRG
jgi:GntR family transcriptional regulator